MANQGEILDTTRELLFRPTVAQIHYTDTAPELAGSGQDDWWRYTDFDSSQTIDVKSAGLTPDPKKVPIGRRPWLGRYGLVLADDLLSSRDSALADQVLHMDPENIHPDMARELQQATGAMVALANCAPRDDTHKNGSDFYLALTEAGLEVYATPLSMLTDLDARHRITALYRIPTEGHPLFDGDHEQFRSSSVVKTRQHPWHLEPVFEYASRQDVIGAKQAGEHPCVIPEDARNGHITFIDVFGNVKLDLKDSAVLGALTVQDSMGLTIENHGTTHELEVAVSESLITGPLGKLAVYANCSDPQDKDGSVFVELAARVNDPSTSTDTAAFQLYRHIPDLDPATANVRVTT